MLEHLAVFGGEEDKGVGNGSTLLQVFEENPAGVFSGVSGEKKVVCAC